MAASAFDGPFEELKHRVLDDRKCLRRRWGGTCAALGVLLVPSGSTSCGNCLRRPVSSRSLCGVAAGAVLLVTFARAAYRKTRDVLLARRLDESGATGGEIVAGYELQSFTQGTVPAAGLTRGLAELAVSRATRIATEIPVALAAPAQPFRRSAYCLGACWPAPDRGRFCAATGRDRAAPGSSIRLAIIPRIRTRSWTVEPGDAQIRYGDGLEVTVATSGPPVEELDLVMRSERR